VLFPEGIGGNADPTSGALSAAGAEEVAGFCRDFASAKDS
jgi:hypothetical protein